MEGEPLRWAPDSGWMADTGSQPTDFVLLSLISRLLLVLAFTILTILDSKHKLSNDIWLWLQNRNGLGLTIDAKK